MRAYWKGDYSSMAEILSSTDWQKEFEGADVEACWNTFKDEIRDAIDKFIPISQPRRRKISSFMRKETIKLINKREKLFSASLSLWVPSSNKISET